MSLDFDELKGALSGSGASKEDTRVFFMIPGWGCEPATLPTALIDLDYDYKSEVLELTLRVWDEYMDV